MGPALVLLAWIDKRGWQPGHPLVVIGRVPMFFYVMHFWLIHVTASAMAFASHGSASLAWLFTPPPSMGGPAALYPPGFGYSLGTTYVVWLAVVLTIYPLCRWFAGVKARRTVWWLGYLLTRPAACGLR